MFYKKTKHDKIFLLSNTFQIGGNNITRRIRIPYATLMSINKGIGTFYKLPKKIDSTYDEKQKTIEVELPSGDSLGEWINQEYAYALYRGGYLHAGMFFEDDMKTKNKRNHGKIEDRAMKEILKDVVKKLENRKRDNYSMDEIKEILSEMEYLRIPDSDPYGFMHGEYDIGYVRNAQRKVLKRLSNVAGYDIKAKFKNKTSSVAPAPSAEMHGIRQKNTTEAKKIREKPNSGKTGYTKITKTRRAYCVPETKQRYWTRK